MIQVDVPGLSRLYLLIWPGICLSCYGQNMIPSWQNAALTYVKRPFVPLGCPCCLEFSKSSGFQASISLSLSRQMAVRRSQQVLFSSKYVPLHTNVPLPVSFQNQWRRLSSRVHTHECAYVYVCAPYGLECVTVCLALMLSFLSWTLSGEFLGTWLKWQLRARLKGSKKKLYKGS